MIIFKTSYQGYEFGQKAELGATEETRLISAGIAVKAVSTDKPEIRQLTKNIPHAKFKNFIPITDVSGSTWSFGGTAPAQDKGLSTLYGGSTGVSARLRIEQNSGLTGTAITTLPAPVDLTAAEYIEYSFYCKEYAITDETQQQLYLFSSSPGTADSFVIPLRTKKPGWNIVRIRKSAFTPIGAPVWNDIKQVQVRLNSKVTSAGEIYCSKIQGVPIRANVATFCMTFDDGSITEIEAAHIMASRGIKGSFYIIDTLSGGGTYMEKHHYEYLKLLGHEVTMHGATAPYTTWPIQYADQGDTLFRKTLKNEVKSLQSKGIDTRYASYPGGAWGDRTTDGDKGLPVVEALRSAGLEYIRTTQIDLDPVNFSYANYSKEFPRSSRLISAGFSFSTEVTLAEAKAYIDDCIDYGSTIICYGHILADIIDGITWTHADFIDFCDYIVAKRNAGLLNIMSYVELCDSLYANGMLTDYES